MSRLKQCKHCECDFSPFSQIKQRTGGYIDECAECVIELRTERTVKYRGVIGGSGKMAALSIVSFNSESEADAYVSSFNSCGFGKRKTNLCNEINHTHVAFNAGNENHKGKL
jgi:hypothetical protein